MRFEDYFSALNIKVLHENLTKYKEILIFHDNLA